ncbi:MAG: YggS family pyridoxal phosphate-dependent enzyme [Acidobacteriota bacterium]
MTAPSEAQLADARERWADLERRVASACRRSGRERSGVTLLGACKRQPIERLLAVYEAGLRDFAENQVQSGESNRPQLPDDVRWHLIGPLQSNKARRAAGIFDTFHAVDRMKIARALDRHAARPEPLRCFLEVNLGAEESKHGFLAEQIEDAARELSQLERLEVVGLMAIPPRAESEDEARGWFRQLRELLPAAEFESQRPQLLSMGMSSDFEIAIEEGATHVRIGTSLFGARD